MRLPLRLRFILTKQGGTNHAHAVQGRSLRNVAVNNITMAIKPKCDKCKEELKEFGAILLSPPDKKSTVKKFHLCKKCYRVMFREMRA